MKHLFLAVTALSLAGTIGTANAVTVPLVATDLGIWHEINPSPGNGLDPTQVALPAARTTPGSTLISGGTHDPAAGPIFLDGQPDNMVGSFLASGPIVTATCGGTCATTILSTPLFVTSTLFEFSFTAPSSGSLTINHDDGVSLFTDSGVGNSPTGSDLFMLSDANPTPPVLTEAVGLTGGQHYDLFYMSANGLPEMLHTNFTPVVPAPLIGHGLLVLLAVGGVLLGGKLLESLKKRHLHAA